jgi:hypothetical protein
LHIVASRVEWWRATDFPQSPRLFAHGAASRTAFRVDVEHDAVKKILRGYRREETERDMCATTNAF